MARPGVSYDEVVRCIEQLRKVGNEPSIIAIHQLLGRGSFSTITEHRKKYLALQPSDLASGRLPEPLLLALNATLTAAENSARTESIAELECLQRDLATLVDDCKVHEEEISSLAETVEILRGERDLLAGKLAQQEASQASQSLELDRARSERDQAAREAANATAALAEALHYKVDAKSAQAAEKDALTRAAMLEGQLEELRRATCSTANYGSPNTPSASQHRIATASLSDLALVLRSSRHI